MQDEIFGPIVPLILGKSLDEIIAQQREKGIPLALYVFSGDDGEVEEILANTKSGGVCVNNCIQHMQNEVLPFGGMGESGFGNYRAEWGFKSFSHERAVMHFGDGDFNQAKFPG